MPGVAQGGEIGENLHHSAQLHQLNAARKNENCTFLIILGASLVLVVAVGNEYHNQIDGSILTNIIELHTEFNKLGHFILFLQNPFWG